MNISSQFYSRRIFNCLGVLGNAITKESSCVSNRLNKNLFTTCNLLIFRRINGSGQSLSYGILGSSKIQSQPSVFIKTVEFKELESTASAKKRLIHFKECMSDVFKLTPEEIEDIIQRFPKLWKEYYYKTFLHLEVLGLKKATFIKYPWLTSRQIGCFIFSYHNNN